MKYYTIEIPESYLSQFRVDLPCVGSHGNKVLVLTDRYNHTIGFELKPKRSGSVIVDEDGNTKCSNCGETSIFGRYCHNCGVELKEVYKE